MQHPTHNLFVLFVVISVHTVLISCQVAFPGAQGAGANTVGGRGGRVIKVTNLKDSGDGSLRAAIEQSGARIVIFTVSGTIELTSDIKINNGYITIAGQTAPGDGICLKGRSLMVQAAQVIIRYIRVRPGDIAGVPLDAITVLHETTENVILDHISATWASDETITVTGVKGLVTVQWCIIASSLHDSVHPKGNHGYGSLIRGGTGVTYHHNLYADNRSRNPRTQQGLIEWSNNVVYNWNEQCGYNEAYDPAIQLNYRNNWGKIGPNTADGKEAMFNAKDSLTIYFSGNTLISTDQSLSSSSYVSLEGAATRSTPFSIPGVALTLESSTAAYNAITSGVGCSLFRDSVDTAIINNVKSNTGKHIDSQQQVGGWPTLRNKSPYTDTDGDGMPDAWEKARGTNPTTADPNKMMSSGYRAIESCINEINFWKSGVASAVGDDRAVADATLVTEGTMVAVVVVGVLLVVVLIVVLGLYIKRGSLTQEIV